MTNRWNPKKHTNAGDDVDKRAEAKFLDAYHENDGDRFGNPMQGDVALQLAFRAGMSWARLRTKSESEV